MTARALKTSGLVLYVAFVICWIVLRIPAVERFADDAGLGHQLAGAAQLLGGEHPFIDFRSSYGPGVFYLTALGQWLSGGRIAGEWAVEIAGNGLVYLTLLILILKAGPGRPVAVVLGVLAVLCMPRLWKYFMFLGLLPCLLCCWEYFERPRRSRLFLLAACVALSGLLRQDLGVYAFVCAVAALLYTARSRSLPGMSRLFFEFCLFVLVAASPYLLWAAVQGGLGTYLYDSILITVTKSEGLSKPFPTFVWRPSLFSARNALPWLYTFFYLQPLFGALVCAASWSRLDPRDRLRWLTTLVLSGLCLLQAAHRSDFDHLLQAIPVSFVLMALLAGGLRARSPAGILRGALVVWALLATFSCAMLLDKVPRPSIDVRGHLNKMALYTRSRSDFLEHVTRTYPGKMMPALSRDIRRCTSPDERFLALPFFPTLYYLSGRMFAAEQMMTAPGYYDSEEYQRRAISNLDRQNVPIFVNAPHFAYDKMPERALTQTHPLLWNHLDRSYVVVKQYRRFTLALRKSLDEVRARRLLDCLRESGGPAGERVTAGRG